MLAYYIRSGCNVEQCTWEMCVCAQYRPISGWCDIARTTSPWSISHNRYEPYYSDKSGAAKGHMSTVHCWKACQNSFMSSIWHNYKHNWLSSIVFGIYFWSTVLLTDPRYRPYGHLRCHAFFRVLAYFMKSECWNAPRPVAGIAVSRLGICLRLQNFEGWQILNKLSYLRDSACRRSLHCSSSFKIIDVHSNRKPVCDFILVNRLILTSNFHSVLHHFLVIMQYWSSSPLKRGCL